MSPAPHVTVTVTGPNGQSSRNPRGHSASLTCEPLKPTWQSRGGLTFGKTVWGLWSHPGSWANEKRGSQGLVARKAADPPGRCRRGLRRLPRPGRLPATPGRVSDRGHRSGLVRLPKAPHPVPGPSEWRWGMPVQGARHPARGRFMEFSGSC